MRSNRAKVINTSNSLTVSWENENSTHKNLNRNVYTVLLVMVANRRNKAHAFPRGPGETHRGTPMPRRVYSATKGNELLHKENHQHNEKATYGIRENVCKSSV